MNEWNPSPKYRELLSIAQELLEDERRTVRDVYYALEARGHDYSYRQVKRALKKGRRAGFIDPGSIVDSSRQPSHVPESGFNDLSEFYESKLSRIESAYWEDFWRDQGTYVELWLEKQSLESVFRPICSEFNVRLECTRGDWSDSKVWEAKERLESKLKTGKHVTILYFGDYNPSGFHAPVSVQNTLQTYGLPMGRDGVGAGSPRYFDISTGVSYYEIEDHAPTKDGQPPSLEFERVAINTEHVAEFDLPPNPNPSSTDKDELVRDSFMEYVTPGGSNEGDLNIELNALKEYEREFLEDLIRSAIEEQIDTAAREEVRSRIESRRETIREAVSIDEEAFNGGVE